jgi:hypothetical protein
MASQGMASNLLPRPPNCPRLLRDIGSRSSPRCSRRSEYRFAFQASAADKFAAIITVKDASTGCVKIYGKVRAAKRVFLIDTDDNVSFLQTFAENMMRRLGCRPVHNYLDRNVRLLFYEGDRVSLLQFSCLPCKIEQEHCIFNHTPILALYASERKLLLIYILRMLNTSTITSRLVTLK